MNVAVLQIVGLLILGTAGCVSAHENDGSGSAIPGGHKEAAASGYVFDAS